MHDESIRGGCPRASGESVRPEAEVSVLRELLTFDHPMTLTELLLYFGSFEEGSSLSSSDRDAYEIGARELIGAGLIRRTAEDYLLPTRAAHKFAELAEFP